jgi:hypothetical protein
LSPHIIQDNVKYHEDNLPGDKDYSVLDERIGRVCRGNTTVLAYLLCGCWAEKKHQYKTDAASPVNLNPLFV